MEKKKGSNFPPKVINSDNFTTFFFQRIDVNRTKFGLSSDYFFLKSARCTNLISLKLHYSHSDYNLLFQPAFPNFVFSQCI